MDDDAAATIFVSVAAFRDAECRWTVRDLFEKAARPGRVHVGVCWQADDDMPTFAEEGFNVSVTQMPWQDARGPGFARARIQTELYAGEDYYFQIDSHCRFERCWDSLLIAWLRTCEQSSSLNGSCRSSSAAADGQGAMHRRRAIITAYPCGYTLPVGADGSTDAAMIGSASSSEPVHLHWHGCWWSSVALFNVLMACTIVRASSSSAATLHDG